CAISVETYLAARSVATRITQLPAKTAATEATTQKAMSRRNVPHTLSSGGPSGFWNASSTRGGAALATATSCTTLVSAPVAVLTMLTFTWKTASARGRSIALNVTVTLVGTRPAAGRTGSRKSLGCTRTDQPGAPSTWTFT